MKEPTTYEATDRRVYWGARCSDMERERRHTEKLRRRMKAADPTASCTWFPAEDQWLAFTTRRTGGPSLPLTGNFHDSQQLAMVEAILVLENPTATETIR